MREVLLETPQLPEADRRLRVAEAPVVRGRPQSAELFGRCGPRQRLALPGQLVQRARVPMYMRLGQDVVADQLGEISSHQPGGRRTAGILKPRQIGCEL